MKIMAQTNAQSGSFSVVLPTIAAMLLLASLVALVTGLALTFPDPM